MQKPDRQLWVALVFPLSTGSNHADCNDKRGGCRRWQMHAQGSALAGGLPGTICLQCPHLQSHTAGKFSGCANKHQHVTAQVPKTCKQPNSCTQQYSVGSSATAFPCRARDSVAAFPIFRSVVSIIVPHGSGRLRSRAVMLTPYHGA